MVGVAENYLTTDIEELLAGKTWVPTGMNIGVSQTMCGKVIRAALARPCWARTSKDNAGEMLDGNGADDVIFNFPAMA